MSPRAVLLAGAVALLPAAIGTAAAGPATENPAPSFAPPTTPLTLTRTLYRSLHDGKQVVVTRRYRIRFTREGDGFRVDGELLGAEVDAPPILAELAEIERKRPDLGLFPALLDADGMIRGEMRGAIDPATRERTIASATAMLAKGNLPAETRQEAIKMVPKLAAAGSGTSWPSFLFNPGPHERVEKRTIPLSDGSTGQVEVRIHAEGLMPGGLAQRVERVTTTRLPGSERVTREVWTLTL